MTEHIRISDIEPVARYIGDGVQTQFPFSFPIFQASDLKVWLDDAQLLAGIAVAGAGNDTGGTVTLTPAPAAGVLVTLRRILPIRRLSDFQEGGAFRAKVINDELDYLTAVQQQLAEQVANAVRLPRGDQAAQTELPPAQGRAGRLLAFDGDGGVAVVDPVSLVAVAAYAGRRWYQLLGDGVATVFTLPAEPGLKANLAVYFDGLRQHPDQFSLVGATVTFTEAPPAGSAVLFDWGEASNTPPAIDDDSIADAKLVTTGVAAGTYGAAGKAVQLVVNAKGRLTAAAEMAMTPDWSNIQGLPPLVPIERGGTGAVNAAQARQNLGLGSAALQNSTAFATAAQGAKADSAQQATLGINPTQIRPFWAGLKS